jgi:hypothetical protein
MQIVPRALDDLDIGQIAAWPDRDDRTVAHVHVARREISDAGVHSQHGGPTDHEFAARRQRRGWARGRSRARLLGKKLTRCANHGGQSGRSLEHLAPAHTKALHPPPPRIVRLSEMPTTKRLYSTFKWRMRRAVSSYFWRLCLRAAAVLPIARNEKFGTFSFYGQLLDRLNDLPAQSAYSV